MTPRTTTSQVLTIAAAFVTASVAAQKPQPNVLSGELMTAGPVRTGFKHGPTPVGGPTGSIALDRPGATHEKLQFGRGVIPTEAQGGPKLTFSPILTKHEHMQDIEPIGDWRNGAAYFAVTHSQHESGHFFILKTTRVARIPNEHEVFNAAGIDGGGVWYQKMHALAPSGQYNHPGDISSVGNVLVIAGQNWPGHPAWKLRVGRNAAPDAVLFYDVANPEKPQYRGKIEIKTIAPVLSDLSNLWAGKVGNKYYMALGDGSRTLYFASDTMTPTPASWKLVRANAPFFMGDTIIPVRDEGSTTPVYWSLGPTVDDYKAVSVHVDSLGVLQFGGDVRTYDIADSAFKADGSSSGVHVSKRGRMMQVSIDVGFKNDVLALESYSIHFARNNVLLPPANPFLPLRDSFSWTDPSYYRTIQSADLNGDGSKEILARWANGVVARDHQGRALPGTIPLSDAAGWKHPSNYMTIQTADIDGDGRAEVLARAAGGLIAFEHTGSGWRQKPGIILLTNATGFLRPENYLTIQTADVNGDGRDEVLTRTPFGFFGYSYDGNAWKQLPGSIPLSDALGFNKPEYYMTIQTADLNGDGRAEVIGRSAFGLFAYEHRGDWKQLPGSIGLTDAAGFNRPEYYRTIQTADVDGDGRDEVLVRFFDGLHAFHYNGARWLQKGTTITLFSDANGFKSVGNWSTIQTADLDGDDRAEVIGRYYWGLASFRYDDNGQWKPGKTLRYLGDYSGYTEDPYTATMQAGDLNGDGRDEFLARLRTGLYVWKPEDLGFGRALPIGVKRLGLATAKCKGGAPVLNVSGRPDSTQRGFRLMSENAPANTVGLQLIAGAALPNGVSVLGARVYVNPVHPSLLIVAARTDAAGRFGLPLPTRGLARLNIFAQSVWLNPQPCANRLLSATGALDITVR